MVWGAPRLAITRFVPVTIPHVSSERIDSHIPTPLTISSHAFTTGMLAVLAESHLQEAAGRGDSKSNR